jgi:hypothetical protein
MSADQLREELELTIQELNKVRGELMTALLKVALLETRLSVHEPLPHQWRLVQCTTTGGVVLDDEYNIVRERDGETWKDSNGTIRCTWEHHGKGQYSKQYATEIARQLNDDTNQRRDPPKKA